jgi:hypothetical protein
MLVDADATRDNIIKALSAVCAAAKEVNARTFIYFSGHGGQDANGVSYILPTDARHNEYSSTAISARELSRLLDECRGELTVVLDCCRAASLLEDDLNAGVGLAEFDDSLRSAAPAERRPTNRVIIAAARARGKAFRSPNAPYSLLTGHMLARLRGDEAELTGGTDVTVDQLFAYLVKHVRHDSNDTQHPLRIAQNEIDYALTNYPEPIKYKPVFVNDIFISYDREDVVLDAWVENIFQEALLTNGISIWDYNPIGNTKLYAAKAIRECRIVVAVLTRAYFHRKGALEEFAATMAIVQAVQSGTVRFIAVLREDFDISPHPEFDTWVRVDMTPKTENRFPKNMSRLVDAIKRARNQG